MTGSDTGTPPFDVFSLAQDVRERFGWSNEDLSRVMEQLMPAALNGFRHFGSAVPGFSEFPGLITPGEMLSPSALAGTPFAGFVQNASEAALTPFFGPEAVQQALASQISGLTGLQSDAIQEMMPVAATLAMGQVVRPFVHGEARNLLDAYLRGFARGRPKPQPTPADYLQGYANAMNAFWSAFLQPATLVTHPDGETGPEDEAPELELEEEPLAEEPHAGEPQAEDEEADPEPSEFEEMVSSWMAAGRDFQSSQFKTFDSFFEKAARDLDGD